MDIFNIKDGWMNYILHKISSRRLPEDVKKEAIRRSKICFKCDKLIVKRKKDLFGSEKKVFKCNACGCSFPAMVYAMKKKCAIGKWNT